MTFEEVVEEMRKHLTERRRAEDELVPLGAWRELMGSEMTRNRFVAGLVRAGGKELVQTYAEAVRERRRAIYAALELASAERRSLAAVAASFGRAKQNSSQTRRLGLRPMRERLSVERVRAVVAVGMSLNEVAAATGYKRVSLLNWVKRGRFGDMVKLSKRSLGNRGRVEYYVSEVLDGH